MVKYIIGLIVLVVWLFVLKVLDKSKLRFWHYIVGSLGLFVILFIFVEPLLTRPLSQIVALLASLPGKIGNMYQAYYRYGTIFVNSRLGAITLQIDLECSGIIEIMAYVSLLTFFRVYSISERITVGILGTIGIVLANALRIVVICTMIYFGGTGVYYIAHTFVGRIVFYVLSIILYFYVFTKPQIIKQKVGKFKYDASK